MVLFQRFAREDQAEGGMIVHDHTAVAVENAAAWGRDRHRFDAVLLRALVVKLRILYLKFPEAPNQKQENAYTGVLENRNSAGRKPRVIATRRPTGALDFVVRLDRGQDHKNFCSVSILILKGRFFTSRFVGQPLAGDKSPPQLAGDVGPTC